MDLNPDSFLENLRGLQSKGELCDIVLIACGQKFKAHQVVLAAASSNFQADVKSYAGSKPGPKRGGAQQRESSDVFAVEITLEGIAHGDAVQAMLDYVYTAGKSASNYTASSVGMNSDVLRLATALQIQGLRDCAVNWLACLAEAQCSLAIHQECVAACDEFGLSNTKRKLKSAYSARETTPKAARKACVLASADNGCTEVKRKLQRVITSTESMSPVKSARKDVDLASVSAKFRIVCKEKASPELRSQMGRSCKKEYPEVKSKLQKVSKKR